MTRATQTLDDLLSEQERVYEGARRRSTLRSGRIPGSVGRYGMGGWVNGAMYYGIPNGTAQTGVASGYEQPQSAGGGYGEFGAGAGDGGGDGGGGSV